MVFSLQPFVRHDTPHPKDLKGKHPKFKATKGIDGHVIPHHEDKSQVRTSWLSGSLSYNNYHSFLGLAQHGTKTILHDICLYCIVPNSQCAQFNLVKLK